MKCLKRAGLCLKLNVQQYRKKTLKGFIISTPFSELAVNM